MSNDLTILCRINSKDEIIFYNENCCQLAATPDISKLPKNKILNHSLWDFIRNKTKAYLYREMLQKVRVGNTLHFRIRNSFVNFYQLLELIIKPHSDGEIQFEIRPLTKPEIRLQRFTKKNMLHEPEMIIVCSWCNRINTEKDEWLEAEKAINILKLFELENLPNLSHGMCNECYQVMSVKLYETPK